MEKSAERIAFEEWADDGFALTLLWDDEAGEYCNPTIQAEWNAWNTAWYLSAIHQAKQPQDTEQASQPQGTPSSRWAAEGQPDPHDDRYNCERAALCMGDLTDDELANAAFLNYDRWPRLEDIIAGKAHPPIAYMTAVKDRIRWLSRKLTEATKSA